MIDRWSTADSKALYRVGDWGEGYFDIAENGNVAVRPAPAAAGCDLRRLMDALVQRGIQAPILFRFEGIIRDRLHFIEDSFDAAIKQFNYSGKYHLAFPIKVNQQRHVVDSLLKGRRGNRLALEVGSKPELIAVLALHDAPGSLLLCNGYKDREYIELALLGRKVGRRSIIIVEQLSEVDEILAAAERLGIEPEIGLRFRPTTRGQGRWGSSAGERGKFGLNAQETVAALHRLRALKREQVLKLLHYHVGSQITAIATINKVLEEGTRMYTEIARDFPSLCFFDVGGGLAVDYDGSRTNFESSMNYSVGEYARDVVSAIGEACNNAKLHHPHIISESGRAVLAHHAVLVAEVEDVARLPQESEINGAACEHPLIAQLHDLERNLTVKNCQESWHDANDLRHALHNHFIVGNLRLRERALAEGTYRRLAGRIADLAKSLAYVPEDLQRLDDQLLETFFCNFSVFQSIPDFWAIGNLFPVLPIQRLNEEPIARAVLADITCDSDGKLDRFIDLKDVSNHVRLHYPGPNESYYIGIFLLGAYQEILGDLHNLFGDTNAVHVQINEDGSYTLPSVVEGDTIREVLEYVQYDVPDLIERLRVSAEKALAGGELSPEESATLLKRYKEALEGYTYLTK